MSSTPLSNQEAELQALRAQVAQLTQQLEETETRLRETGIVDPDTDLFSYRYFLGRLIEEVARADRFSLNLSLQMISLNREEPQGLLELAKVLRKNSRQYDVLARWGQNEVAMLMPAADIDGAQISAERIRLAAFEAFAADPALEGLNVSIGAAAYPASGIEGSEQLLEAAFNALRVAVDAGGNRVALRNA